MAINNEQLLISAILRNGNLDLAFKCGLSNKMFHVYNEEFTWIEEFYLKRSRTPEVAAFAKKFPNFVRKAVDDTEHYTYEVREEHKKRALLQAALDHIELIEQDETDAALNAMHSSAMKISSELGLINDGDIFRDNEDVMLEFAMRRERFEKYGASGIQTNFETFDDRTGGFAPGEMWIFAARPGGKKSYTLQKFATEAAMAGHTVQYNALEQPRANVMARIVPMISQRVGRKLFQSRSLIRGNEYDPVEFNEFMQHLKANVKGNLHVADGTQGKVSTAMVASQIERNKPDIVFIDHISLMEKQGQDWQALAQVADDLTQLANQYNIPIVCASQLNRNGSQKGAGLESIAEADKIAQNASGVVFIHSMSKHTIKYQVEKIRNDEGSFGWWAKFAPNEGVFREVDFPTAEQIMEADEAEEMENK